MAGLQGEGIAQPLDPGRSAPVPVDSDDIEPGLAIRMHRPPRQVDLGSSAQFTLFDEVDRVGCRRETFPGAVADLYEYETLGVQHDEIDFAKATLKVAFDRIQSLLLQVP